MPESAEDHDQPRLAVGDVHECRKAELLDRMLFLVGGHEVDF